jgi:hypothetical protein
MASDRFVILAIDTNNEGVWALLRCTRCGETSGFHFQNEPLWGRYPLLCCCGTEVLLDVSRPVLGPRLVDELQDLFSWAPVIERRLRPKLN